MKKGFLTLIFSTIMLLVTLALTSTIFASSNLYYQVGDILPNDSQHVRWYLGINTQKASITGDVWVDDTVQSGQTIDPNSFFIRVQGWKPGEFGGANAIANFKAAYPGSDIGYDLATNRIVIFMPQSQATYNYVGVTFLTNITNQNQSTFENNSTVWYQEFGQPAVGGQSVNASVNNINFNNTTPIQVN